MNSKATAAIMATIMVLMTFAAVSADGADGADGTPEISVGVDETNSTTHVAINEANYMNYTYTLKWQMKVGNGQYTDVADFTGEDRTPTKVYINVEDSSISTNADTNTNFSVNIVANSNIGVYTFEITGVSVTEGTTISFKPEITLTIGGVSKPIIYEEIYALDVSVFDVSDGKIEITFDTENIEVGQYINRPIELIGMNVEDYDWYAVGLPAGLTMSSNGHVSGIPTEITADEASFKVFATHSNGTVYYDDSVPIEIVKPESSVEKLGFTYKVGNTTTPNEYNEYGVYVFEAVNDVYLSVLTSEDDVVTNADVKIIGTSNVATDAELENDVYKIHTSSADADAEDSGVFTVSITYNDETETIKVYIVGTAAEIGPDIFIVGS